MDFVPLFNYLRLFIHAFILLAINSNSTTTSAGNKNKPESVWTFAFMNILVIVEEIICLYQYSKAGTVTTGLFKIPGLRAKLRLCFAIKLIVCYSSVQFATNQTSSISTCFLLLTVPIVLANFITEVIAGTFTKPRKQTLVSSLVSLVSTVSSSLVKSIVPGWEFIKFVCLNNFSRTKPNEELVNEAQQYSLIFKWYVYKSLLHLLA